LVVI